MTCVICTPSNLYIYKTSIAINQTLSLLRTLASRWNKQKFRCYEAKIEESEKAGSRRESNPGHLACAASALPLSYNNRTTNGTY